MRPESPARRRSVEVQSPPQLQVTGEGLHSSTPAWVTRLSRPSTAPALRAAWALSPGSRGEPDIPEPPPPDSRRSTQERSSRRSGVPSWVDRLANKPSRGRAASPARATLDAPTSRPESAASRSRSSQAASVSGRPPSRQTAWDAEAIKESLARLRAARSSTCSEHSASSKDFRIPAIRRGDDSAREAAVSQQAACRAAQESSHSSADENAAVIQPRSNQPVKPKPEDSAAQAHHRAASADHFPRPALLQPAPLPPGYRPAERRSETATPVPTFRHPAAAGTAHNNVFAVSHVALQQPEVTPLGPRKPSGILSTEAQVVPQQQQQHPAAPSQRADARPATAGPKLEHQPAAGDTCLSVSLPSSAHRHPACMAHSALQAARTRGVAERHTVEADPVPAHIADFGCVGRLSPGSARLHLGPGGWGGRVLPGQAGNPHCVRPCCGCEDR